jgi:hypothetical protein
MVRLHKFTILPFGIVVAINVLLGAVAHHYSHNFAESFDGIEHIRLSV